VLFPWLLLAATVFASALGVLGIVWCRCRQDSSLARWGRRIVIGVLGLLGLGSALIALQPHRGLVYLGLTMGLLVVAMMWERTGEAAWRWEGDPSLPLR
jgi:heme A synthase